MELCGEGEWGASKSGVSMVWARGTEDKTHLLFSHQLGLKVLIRLPWYLVKGHHTGGVIYIGSLGRQELDTANNCAHVHTRIHVP